MFARKNQNILSEHYAKLVDRDAAGDDDGDDIFTLKRADHGLESDEDAHANTSKRKQKIGVSKKAMLKYKEQPSHIKFDDAGEAQHALGIKGDDEFRKGDVKALQDEFAKKEKERLRDADTLDRQVAKDKKKEKKRKRKDRDREDVRLLSPCMFGQELICRSRETMWTSLLWCRQSQTTDTSLPTSICHH